MRNTTLARLALVLLLALLSTACATSRGEMALGVPGAKADYAEPTGDRVAVIEWVRDQRVFETDPRDPSIPSLKKGSDYVLDAEGRKRAIARKRNGYGMALGDILLEGGETVETLTRDLVTTGLHERGIRVLEAGAQAPADAIRLRVDIREFWAWFSPGFWSVSMEAKLRMDFEVVDPVGDRKFTVSAYGINKGQSGREANWRLAYDRAFEDYLAKQRGAFQRHGL
ncbi:MAG: hypothetical protein ABIJ73_12820 [Pseudomonadota bacterium]